MNSRERDLRPDPQGRYRPYLGWKIGVDDERRQHRFNLGTDKREAERRMALLRSIWDENCRQYGDTWEPSVLVYAEAVARGEQQILQRPVPELDDEPDEYARMVDVNRQNFPGVNFVPTDSQKYAEGREANEAYIKQRLADLETELRTLGALTGGNRLPEKIISGTLHEAFSAYAAEIEKTAVRPGKASLTPYGRLRLRRVDRFKFTHPDMPLHSLTYDACRDMVTHWKSRPAGKRSTTTSRDNARHHVGELMRFFRWLDSTDKFQWEMPRGVDRIDRKIARTEGEKKISAITKETYTLEELATLNHHATPLERLMLYLGLNCAMGAAEMGRLQTGDIILNQAHEHAGRLHFHSTDADNFIRFLRPKTSAFGEWLLWGATVVMVRWALARAKDCGSNVLLASDRGEPWYSEDSTNSQAKFANVWTRLINRVRKSQPEFRYLPFGTLRDTLPDVLRHRYGDELASLSLAHGAPFNGDNLLDCYGNKPFGRLHTALRELEQYFQPMFQAGPQNPCEEMKQYLPVAVRDKMRRLIQERKGVTAIMRECGVSDATVYREKERMAAGEK